MTIQQPKLIIVGGANGSGKTTFAQEYLKYEKDIYLSADNIAFELRPDNPSSQSIQAGRIFHKQFLQYLNQKTDLLIESTLSGRSLKNYIKVAEKLGYHIILFYIFLDSPQLCNARIAARVKKGGHFIAPEDVERRFYRSQKNFWECYKQQAHSWFLIYNAGENFVFAANELSQKNNILNHELFRLFQSQLEGVYDN